MKKGSKMSQESIQKMSQSRKGKKLSDEHKRNIGLGNKGKIISKETCKRISLSKQGEKHPMFGKKHSLETLNKMSESHSGTNHYNFGKHPSEETIKKFSDSHKGIHPSEETRIKLSELQIGEKCHFWKGGITPENKIIRNSVEYRLWRESVFVKDNFTCQKTGVRGGYLIAHHINNFADFPELRFAIDNGITLSRKAHILFHLKYGFKNNTREQLLEFLNN